jgi:branched-chain amino acid transport system ATP-binding protein
MLNVEDLHAHYGKSHVLQGVNFAVEEAETVTLIGRNGVGKTTTLKTIMGLIKPSSGCVVYNGENLTGKKPNEIYNLGLGYVPQGRKIFSTLTVEENLNLGKGRSGIRESKWILDMFPILNKRLKQGGGKLSGGEQQMLAIARVLLGGPQMILLDEPSEGLAPLMLLNILEILIQLKKMSITTLLVEANLSLPIKIGDRHYILDQGSVVLEVETERLQNDDELLDKYFRI